MICSFAGRPAQRRHGPDGHYSIGVWDLQLGEHRPAEVTTHARMEKDPYPVKGRGSPNRPVAQGVDCLRKPAILVLLRERRMFGRRGSGGGSIGALAPPSSSGLGRRVLSAETGVRFPVGVLEPEPGGCPAGE